MTRRVRIELNCGHGRLVEADSHEAGDILRTGTAQCLQCPTYLGEARYEGVVRKDERYAQFKDFLDVLAIRRYGMTTD